MYDKDTKVCGPCGNAKILLSFNLANFYKNIMNTMTLKKSAAGIVLAATAMFGLSSAANAQTLLEMALQNGWTFEQFQAAMTMSGGSSSNTTGSTTGSTCGTTVGYTATSTLRRGMSGAAVSALQTALNNFGGQFVVADGQFGPATQAAVQAFQASRGLTADGIAGPMTQAALVTASTMTVPCTDNGGNPGNMGGNNQLNGSVGSATFETISQYSNEEVGEGQEDVVVAGLRVEAGNDSDIMITSIKLNFNETGAGADSKDLDDYADEIKVWFDGEEVGSVDADDFSERSDDSWEATIALDAGVIIEADEEEDILVSVTALNNLDSGDIDSDEWTVDFQTVRFVDGDGVVTSEDAGTNGVTFDFEDFAGATDVELRAALENEDINDARVLNVDDTNDTKHEILSFTLEARGDSDITVDEIPFVIETTGETNESVIVLEANLWMDGEEIATENVPDGGVVVFDDLDITIDAGDEIEFVLQVELADTDGALDDGDTVKATLTVASIDAEDEAGDTLAGADLTGSAVGDAHAAYEVGFELDLVSATQVKTVTSDTSGVGDQAQFVIKYEVTAFDGDIWIDNTCVEDNDGSEVATATSYSVTNDGSNTTNCITTSTGDTVGGNSFLIEEGTSETITLTVNVTATADAFAQVALEAIGWDYEAGGDDEVYSFNLDDFETDPIFLNLF